MKIEEIQDKIINEIKNVLNGKPVIKSTLPVTTGDST